MKIAPIALPECLGGALAALRAHPLVEFDISRPPRQKIVVIQLEGALQDFRFIFRREVRRRAKRGRKPRLVKLSAGILLELHSQRRHDIERGMHAGKFLDHADHAPVVLERMKARPRQHVTPGRRIAILRLVHVPQDHQVDAVHRETTHVLFPAGCPSQLRANERGALLRIAGVLEWRFEAMRLIDRYICRQVFSHAFLGLGIFTFVFFVPQLVRLMDLVVRHPASWSTIGILFLSTFPGILSFTLPIGVLVGVLIALGRLSADSELIAMSALGMGRRRLLVPVGILAVGATAITFAMTLWLGPLSVRTFRTIEDRLRAGQASYQVAPRVFDERFPRMVLYVNDIDSASTRWKGVFLAGTDTGRLTPDVWRRKRL